MEQNSSLPNVPADSTASSTTTGTTQVALQLLPSVPALFQEKTAGIMFSSSLSKPVSNCMSLTLGVDDKIKGKIHDRKFVKLSSLLHSKCSVESDNYKMTEKDGELVIHKALEKDSIKTFAKFLEAIHILVVSRIRILHMSANTAKVNIPSVTALNSSRTLPPNKAQLKRAPKIVLQNVTISTYNNELFKIATTILVDWLSNVLEGYDP